MKILIVEDEAIIALHLEMLLTEFGHEVCAIASTATEAMEHAEVYRPDILILDVRLAHGSSGIEAAREIYLRYGIRSILLSGNLDASTREALQPYEPIGYIGKPFLPIDLFRALKKYDP
jgi:two-component system, response regulator PdtaR